MMKLPVSLEKNVHIYIKILCLFKQRKKLQNFPEVAPPRSPQLYLEQTSLFSNDPLCSDSFQYANIFSQSLIQVFPYPKSWTGLPLIPLYSLFGQSEF